MIAIDLCLLIPDKADRELFNRSPFHRLWNICRTVKFVLYVAFKIGRRLAVGANVENVRYPYEPILAAVIFRRKFARLPIDDIMECRAPGKETDIARN